MHPFSRAVLAAALVAFAAPGVASEDPGPWRPPVGGVPVHGFVPGLGPFGISGHAGLDYNAGPGQGVGAAGGGLVAFAGDIAGARFVVVDHGGGIRTTYGQLDQIGVRHGDEVAPGQRIGITGGSGLQGHEPGLLHFGLRVDGQPVDPLVLFRPTDLVATVRLVPSTDALPHVDGPARERRRAQAWFGPSAPGSVPGPWLWDGDGGGGSPFGQALSVLGGGVRWAADEALAGSAAALDALRRVDPAAAAEWAARWAVRGAVFSLLVAEVPPPVAWEIAVASQEVLWASGRGVRDWWRLRSDCTATVPSLNAFAGTGDHLFAVGGVNSFTHRDGSANDLPVEDLGYGPEEAHWFSYAREGGVYAAADTHLGPEVAAERLAQQLQDFARAHPGERVDLIGHSQGGVVIEDFLKRHLAGHEAEYPPIGRVVTLAAPHRGSSVAALAGELASDPLAQAATEALAGWVDLPGPASGASTQLAEGSAYLADLEEQSLPVDVVTIGAVDDVLVTADQTELGGAEHVVVDPAGFLDHSSILTDPTSLGALRLALEGRPSLCVSLPEAVHHRVEPRSIHAAYDLLRSSDVRGVVPGLSS
ncbi:MAG: peptidoglycan DD-metalloendopeptidase family protein [Actinobacteria bacterium]|nr:peptidoglycan DD-metalloendopeptidase family protein [Actinomycetota bacterium]